MYLHWHEMSPREQMVWGAVFAHTHGDPGAVSHHADQAIRALRELELDGRPIGPEYELARTGMIIERESFDAWYRIAFAITYPRDPIGNQLSDAACETAYERYLHSRADFF